VPILVAVNKIDSQAPIRTGQERPVQSWARAGRLGGQTIFINFGKRGDGIASSSR